MEKRSGVILIGLVSFLVASAVVLAGKPVTVTYDSRSLIIDGERELLFSGSIHYPRSPPEMWPDLIRKARDGGLNVIDTYVFWNIHEPIQGQFNFSGNYDLVKFIKLIQENGMWVVLRIGPYVEAEWKFGGFPYWLKEVPGINFRTYNEPFMYHMKRYTEMIVRMMEREQLFAPQGGPIILAQIENEYSAIQRGYKENGKKYIDWAADMATGLYSGIPWIMCKQTETPDKVISACNGRFCGRLWQASVSTTKPKLWTENWTAQYRVFGEPPSQRAAEDLALSVAEFFMVNGTLANYYMYYGGTNYGRISSSFVTTRYYDEAPLDEFGLKREPKYGHLRDLHRAIRLSRKSLFWGYPKREQVGEHLLIYTFEKPGENCAAFLMNNATDGDATVDFRGARFYLPPQSISILPDCKTLVYNTQLVSAQHNARNFVPSQIAKNLQWETYQEKIPTANDLPIKNEEPLELYSLTKDESDYAWFSTSIHFDHRDLPMRPDIKPVLEIASLGHALAAFVNGEYVGFGHGSNIQKNFDFNQQINLKPGRNDITLLGMIVGLPNSGMYMETRYAGPKGVMLEGMMTGTLDLSRNHWSHEVGISGEKLQLFTEEGATKVQWKPAGNERGGAVTWYKTRFDAPEGNDPVAINMESMAKGMIWVNGRSIGRYWSSYITPLNKPSQSEYHIPRAFLKPTGNLLVVLEETGGNPGGIEIQTVNRDTICSYISDDTPVSPESWEASGGIMHLIPGKEARAGAYLACQEDKVIKGIELASFGNPSGVCGAFNSGNCNAGNTQRVAEERCLGKNSCYIPYDGALFGELSNECKAIKKSLALQARCGK